MQVPPFLHGLLMQSLISETKFPFSKSSDIFESMLVSGDVSVRTFMTVDAAETRITDAAEIAGWLADASSAGAAHVGRNVLHSSRVVDGNGNDAAVNN